MLQHPLTAQEFTIILLGKSTRSSGLAIGSTGRRITMENQAKKRKGGAEKLRDKVLPIKKQPFLFYIKLK